MKRAFAWALVGLFCFGVYSWGSSWTPPAGLRSVPGVAGPFASPVLQSMPPLPAGCRKKGC